MGIFESRQFENAVEDAIIRAFSNGKIRGDGVVEIKAANGSVYIGVRREDVQQIAQEGTTVQRGPVTVENFDSRFS